jgi:hypothetical protein
MVSAQVILENAKEFAKSQGRLGHSPAERLKDGSIVLCAGSCIARSLIEFYGDAAALEEFDAKVLAADKFNFLPSIFRTYGLSQAAAIEAVRENDLRNSSDRLPWFLSLRTI